LLWLGLIVPWVLGGGGEAKVVEVFVEFEAESFDGEVVVFALCQSGDGDCADDARRGDFDGKAAAVSGVVGVGQVIAVAEGAVGLFEHQADGVRAAVEAGDDVALALHPAGVVGSSAERGVEERLIGLAEATDVYDDGLLALEREIAEGEADSPGGVVVEVREDEFGFLMGDLG
jgi:hypothetical protein